MIKKIQLSLALLFFFFSNSLLAENIIKQVRSNSLPNKVQIVIDLDHKPTFDVFVLSKPIRLVVDVKGKVSPNYKNKLSFKNRGVTKVRTGNRSENEIRLVFDLNYDYNWEIYDLPPSGKYGHRIVVDVYDYALQPKLAAKLAAKKSASGSTPIVLESLTENTQQTLVTEQQNKKSVRLSKPPVKEKTKTKPQANNVIVISTKPAQHLPNQADKIAKKKITKAIEQNPKTARSPSQKVISKASIKTKKKATKRIKSRDIIVIIDPGHGGKDSGAVGAAGTKEKIVVLQIAKKLKRKIDAMKGMKAVLTRRSDRYISLRGRLKLARKYKGDLFVSIHADAFTRRSAKGASVYILSNRGASSEAARWLAKRENSVDLKYGVDIGDYEQDVSDVLVKMQQDAAIEASQVLASKTLSRLKGIGKVHKRRVERAGFAVLKSPDIPSMLVETAFISNPMEEKRLKSSAYQDKLATAIAKGIKQYFNVHLPHHLLLMDAPK